MRKRGLLEELVPGGAGLKRPRTDEVPTRIFVGGLAYATNWQRLKDHFSQVGDVEFASVLLKPDGSSKGCGMVNFRSPDHALRAVQLLNESLLDGRHIMVKLDLGADAKRPMAMSSNIDAGTLDSAFSMPQTTADLDAGETIPTETTLPSWMAAEGVRLPPEHISRVFVGNLAFATTWQGLKDHFKTAGTVEFASVLENPDKTSKGVGLVNFATHEEAVNAASTLHESILDGRLITVKLDVDGRYKERPPPKSMQLQEEPTHYTLPPEQISRVFIGNLSYSTNWQALKDHFSQVGDIEFASVLLNHDRTSKGVGMVNFRTNEEAMRAVEMLDNSVLDNRHITVKLDINGHFKERPPPGARPRVFQRSKEEAQALKGSAQASNNTLAALQAVATQLRGGCSGKGGGQATNVRQLTGVLGQMRGSAQATTLDCLNALGRLAQTPVAGQIDWPSLISTVASTVAQSSR